VLRRKQPIVLRDDDTEETGFADTPRSLRRGPMPVADDAANAPGAAFDTSPPSGANDRLNMLRDELDQNPISKGSPQSLEALRAKFRQTLDFPTEETERPDSPGLRLPTGMKPLRLAILLIALIAGGAAAWLATASQPAPVPVVEEPVPVAAPAPIMAKVLVAAADIGAGKRLTADALAWSDWPVDSVPAGFITAEAQPEAIADMTGAMVRTPLYAGEPIHPDKLATGGAGALAVLLEPGTRAVSVTVRARTSSGGFVSPNDRVDVVLTRQTNDGRRISDMILENVRVLSIGGSFAQDSAAKEAAESASFAEDTTAILGLGPRTAEVMLNAATLGELSLILRPLDDNTDAPNDAERAANLAIRLSSPFWNSVSPAGGSQ